MSINVILQLLSVAASASKFWGEGQEIFSGGKIGKMRAKCAQNWNFYAEIVKFGLIITHLKWVLGTNWEGMKKIFGGEANALMPPCCAATDCCAESSLNFVHVCPCKCPQPSVPRGTLLWKNTFNCRHSHSCGWSITVLLMLSRFYISYINIITWKWIKTP